MKDPRKNGPYILLGRRREAVQDLKANAWYAVVDNVSTREHAQLCADSDRINKPYTEMVIVRSAHAANADAVRGAAQAVVELYASGQPLDKAIATLEQALAKDAAHE